MYLLLHLYLTTTWCKVLYLGNVHILHSMPGNALVIITIRSLDLILRTGCSKPTDLREAVRAINDLCTQLWDPVHRSVELQFPSFWASSR
jgi:hypothetical protein